MSSSDAIRDLLVQFPTLPPAAIKRLLAARGVKVNSNLIRVARHRLRQRQASGTLRLLDRALSMFPDLLPVLKTATLDLIRLVVDVAAAQPGATEDDLADGLAKAVSRLPSEETPATRCQRLMTRLLEKHPEYKRSIRLAHGHPEGAEVVCAPALSGDGLDLTDEQVEAALLTYLREHYPPGETVEEIAEARLHASGRPDWDDRHVRVLSMIFEDEPIPGDPEAALAAVRHFVAPLSDWPDDAIADWISDQKAKLVPQAEQPRRYVEDLSIKKRL